MESLNAVSQILMEKEFKGLTSLECLLKIFRENKKAQEKERAECLKR